MKSERETAQPVEPEDERKSAVRAISAPAVSPALTPIVRGLAEDFLQPEPMGLRRRIRRRIEQGLYRTGLDRLYLSMSGHSGVTILTYHAVPRPEDARFIDPTNRMDRDIFVEQVLFLKQHRRVLDVDELMDVVSGKVRPEPGSVVLTFDDGYGDNASFVAPLLDSLGLPAVFYLPTAVITRGVTPWPDRLYCAFRYRTRNELEVPALRRAPFRLDQRSERRRAYSALMEACIAATLDERDALVEGVTRCLEPSEDAPALLMTWDDARRLRREFPRHRLGLHGSEHLDMTRQSRDALRREFDSSVAEFETMLGEPARDFAYPYKRSNENTRSIADACGLRSAMIAESRALVGPGTDPLELPRLNAPDDLALFGHWTSGAYPRLVNVFRK
jgi:peptidoglycan/xylan/chitin deacetylase (PgdA/CDA1 family)